MTIFCLKIPSFSYIAFLSCIEQLGISIKKIMNIIVISRVKGLELIHLGCWKCRIRADIMAPTPMRRMIILESRQFQVMSTMQ